jgi:transcription elongation GreA/GreB family factor
MAAKKSKTTGAQRSVARAMRKRKHGTLKSGAKEHGGRVSSRKQAIAIGLNEARKAGAKVPSPRGKRAGGAKRSAGAKRRSTGRKRAKS